MSTFEVSGVMKFNAIVNNISVISWRSVLLVVETGVTRENQRPAESHRQTLFKGWKNNCSGLDFIGDDVY
jgi:hypothetical protein